MGFLFFTHRGLWARASVLRTVVIKCTGAQSFVPGHSTCTDSIFLILTVVSLWFLSRSGSRVRRRVCLSQYLELVIRTVDLLVIINLKGLQKLEGYRQAFLQTDAVVTPEELGIRLGVLGAAQVPRCLCEQLTAALHWGRGRKERSHRGAVPAFCSPVLCFLSHFSHPSCMKGSSSGTLWSHKISLYLCRSGGHSEAGSQSDKNRSSHPHSCDRSAGTEASHRSQQHF